MRKIINPIIFIVCLIIMTACDNDKEPEIYPIRFNQQDYTIKDMMSTPIHFVDGGGLYEVEIGDSAVIRAAGIDIETNRLFITPVATGESTVTIKDVRANSTVTLNITVVDFYLSFKVKEITGKNNNPYIQQDCEIRYIRSADNRKVLEIVRYDDISHQEQIIAEGVFNIIKTDEDFVLEMTLHRNENEELELFCYSIKATGRVFDIFNIYFDFGWKKIDDSRAILQTMIMSLTEINSDCQVYSVFVE